MLSLVSRCLPVLKVQLRNIVSTSSSRQLFSHPKNKSTSFVQLVDQSRCFSSLIKRSNTTTQLISLGRRPTSVIVQRMFPEIPAHAQKYVGRWLVGCAGMCCGAVILGGVTRLTESGLSITRWDLITGIKPPITAAEWQREFDAYKTTPEYKYLHHDLTLSEFKFIFLMEWSHRLWGRLVGTAFIIPAVYFWRKGWFAKAMKKRVVVFGAMIALQGILGIFMVNSGLKEKDNPYEIPRVSQYRLAAHLGTALLLYTGFLWTGLLHLLPVNAGGKMTPQIAKFGKYAHGTMALVFFTAVSGAFVAGIDAGLVYNSWPKFADRWIPSDIAAFEPKWKNLFENHATVQFNHRHLGELTGLATLGLWFLSRRTPLPPRAKMAANCLAAMALVQISLGITTLLTYVPTATAASHQSGSLVLLGFSIWLANELKRIPK